MKKKTLSAAVLFAAIMMAGCNGLKAKTTAQVPTDNIAGTTDVKDEISKEAKIQVAILLDTSNSMDGLIEQAKSRLWNIVNTLTTLKYKGKTPAIQIALYEYGNDNIPASKKHIRLVTPLTSDLDLISEKLFALTTNGGEEYCGAVIAEAVKALEWDMREADMKLIYIAGNEPFTQGTINYKTAISGALEKAIYINTIHCGGDDWGDSNSWRDAAVRGKGKFFNINHDAKVRYYETPYDAQISTCNEKLNDTYISYGSMGVVKKENQLKQDVNAQSISAANYTERAVSKTKQVYDNKSWDLVDKAKESATALDEVQVSELPAELQNKSKQEIKAIVAQKEAERTNLQKEISDLAKKRQAYIDEQMKKDAGNTGDDLGQAINQSVIDLALAKGYKIEK